MGHDNGIELRSDIVDATSDNSRSPDNSSILVQQTRVRRLFTEAQLFAFSACFLTTWLGVGSSMYYAFLNGGPVAYLFNYIIVLVGVMAQTASLAELASIQPVAGAQYYWTYVRQPTTRKHRNVRLKLDRANDVIEIRAPQVEEVSHLDSGLDNLGRLCCRSRQLVQ